MRWLFIGVLVVLWGVTLAVGFCSIAGIDLGFPGDAATGLLGTVSTGVTALLSWFGVQLRSTRRELEEEKFSTPMALAFGYVQNFLEPTVTKIVGSAEPGGISPIIHIYIPDRLEDLLPLSRQRILARIRENGFAEDIIKLDFDDGRARDIITVTKSGEERPRYFDFPTTLLTLTSLVDYKVASAGEPVSEAEKEAMGRGYIEKFRDYLLECAAKRNLSDHIALTDGELGFLS